MSHFASAELPSTFGQGAQLTTLATPGLYTATATAASTSNSATEGTNLLTYTVATTGLYRVSSYLRVNKASDAAAGHTLAAFVSYSNPTAITAASIGTSGVTPGTLDFKGTLGTSVLNQNAIIYATAGTTIQMSVQEVRAAGAVPTTSPTMDIVFNICGL